MMKLHIFLFVLVAIFSLILCIGCGDDDDYDLKWAPDLDDDDDNDDDASLWAWNVDDSGVLNISYDDRLLFQWAAIERIWQTPRVTMLFGVFRFSKEDESSLELTFEQNENQIYLMQGDETAGRIVFLETEQGNLKATLILDGDYTADALKAIFTKESDDRFWGFGEQYNYVDFAGKSVPIWVQEQGLGRAEDPLLPFQGKLTNTYFPMPYFMDPAKGKGFCLLNPEYSFFDLGETQTSQWSVEVWNGQQASMLFMPGPKPVDVVSQLTSELGRPETAPPDWAFDGVWLAAQGGTETVGDRLEIALNAGVPVTAVWAQDWLGLRDFGLQNFGVKYHWIHDDVLYPNLDGFIEEIGEKGVRFLGYFNPFIVPAYEHYEDAIAGNFIIRRPDGTPYTFIISTFFGSLLDVTSTVGKDYFQSYARQAVDMGQKGWMCDFGEWLPYNALISKGASPSVHNRYPILWHDMNREVLEEAYPDGDWVMFTRSGYTGEQKVAQVVWAGDQECDWSETDGIPTVITAGLTIGLAGVPYFTHDIGGFSGGPREKELFLRWTEMGAFTPVMRTHDGLKKLENHHFDSDVETLEFFARFSKIHSALAPYWMELADDAIETGLPIVRHTVLVDPDWDEAYNAHKQWMLGEDMVYAPVVEKGAEQVEICLPDGNWEHLLTGQVEQGRQCITVDAPLGTPAVFVKPEVFDGQLEAIRSY